MYTKVLISKFALLSILCVACPSSPLDDSKTKDSDFDAADVPSASETDTQSASDEYQYLGLCGTSGEAEVTTDEYVGYEDTYLIGDEGDGPDRCRVRFTVRSVGRPSISCDTCDWSFTVEKTAFEIMTDLDESCATSEIDLTMEKLTQEVGKQVSIGYTPESTGHAHVLLRLNEDRGIWEAVSVASWSADTGHFFYDRKDGFCGY